MPEKRADPFWLNAMFYTMLQRVSLFIFGVAGYMILVRGFTTTTNGVWALFITVFSVFEVVKQGLLRNPTIKFLGTSADQSEKARVQSSSIFVNAIFSLIIISLVFAFNEQLALWLRAPALSTLLLVSTINIVLLVPFNHCEILLQARLQFGTLFTTSFIRQAIFFGTTDFIFFLSHSLHFTECSDHSMLRSLHCSDIHNE